MGSCLSSEAEDGSGPRPYRGKNEAELPPVELPDVVWESDASWAEEIAALWKRAVETHTMADFRDVYQPFLLNRAHDWIERTYPECVKAGSVEDVGEVVYPPSLGPCPHPTRFFLAMDDDFTGVIYAAIAVVAPPLKKSEGRDPIWVRPGGSLGTEDLRKVKLAVLEILTRVRQNGANMNHTWVHIFIGADKYSCKLDSTTKEPTIRDISGEPNDDFKALSRGLAADARDNPDQFRGKFRSSLFKLMVKRRAEEFPGATVWDEGEFAFSVDGAAYPHPTRLFVGRHFSKMDQDVDTQLFKVTASQDEEDPAELPVKLLRNANRQKDPGGIVSVTLLVAVDPDELWSEYGKYFETPAFKAAEKALLEHVKALHRSGKTERCKAYISMGSDQKWYKFVGDKVAASADPAAEALTEKEQAYTSVEPFSITLKEMPKHTLWQSESQFQAIKQQILERSEQNPEAYQNMAVQASLASAMHVLQRNFPGCEVSDEGEFPSVAPGGEKMAAAGTRLVVVRDAKQAPASIIAAQHVVSRPRQGQSFAEIVQTTWLGTDEMKRAEAALLDLLRAWHKEGKVSKVDCMALVSMGVDASIYQFVEGDKFIDYSDERMAQFQWG